MKILRNVGVLLMLVSLNLGASYPDVGERNPYFYSISYLTDQGVLEGYADGNYRPYQAVNRAEMLKILVAGQGIYPNQNNYAHCFPDVTTQWYAPYVCYAKTQGWVQGYPDGYFYPERNINRVESLKITFEAYEISGLSSGSKGYDDIPHDAWFTPYVRAFIAHNMQEDLLEEAFFNPDQATERGLMAELIFRTLVSKDSPDESYSPEQAIAFFTEGNSSERMVKYNIRNASARDAVCNDGSPATYYFRAGFGNGVNEWLVHLKGGSGCSDEATCVERAQESPELVSSLSYPASILPGGIFTQDRTKNPDFYNWNHVYAYYCSSDMWSGEAVREVNGEYFYFNGAAIVQALIEDLSAKGLDEAEMLVFSGSSAGGEGVSNNLDRVAGLLPEVQTLGIVDSSWSDDFGSYDARSGLALRPAEYRNTQFDDSCMASQPTNISFCQHDSTLQTFLSTPVFYYVDQIDNNRLENLGITNPRTADENAWIEDYAEHLREILPNTVKAIFSPHRGPHTILVGDRFFTTKISGDTLQEALGEWLESPFGTHQWIETP